MFSEELIFSGDFSIASGYDMMINALSTHDKIDAVFASNDYIAIGAMRAIEEKGFSIPEDISIIGFDDINFSKHLKPSLSTVAAPLYQEGKKAAEILLDRINGNIDSKVKRIVVKTSLVIRNSVTAKI